MVRGNSRPASQVPGPKTTKDRTRNVRHVTLPIRIPAGSKPHGLLFRGHPGSTKCAVVPAEQDNGLHSRAETADSRPSKLFVYERNVKSGSYMQNRFVHFELWMVQSVDRSCRFAAAAKPQETCGNKSPVI